jgi:hypothetical protein
MTRRSRIAVVAVVAVVIAVCVAWGLWRMRSTSGAGSREATVTDERVAAAAAGPAAAGGRGSAAAPAGAPGPALPPGAAEVTLAGRVIDIDRLEPVGDVDVVFRGASGELTATTAANGNYSIRLAAGVYRAFVRDDAVLSLGDADRVRLPSPPSAEAAGVPDEALMATVIASGDADGIDLPVVRGGVVAGRIVDRHDRPIAGAVVRARGDGARPALGTDVAESDRTGRFELRLPAGEFTLDANHPRFAGIESAADARVRVVAGRSVAATIALTAGCVISGRVIGVDGDAANDGAIEKQWGDGDHQFGPAGRIEPDGTFRWVTIDEGEVSLRAWPWKSPASQSRRFACRDGARFDGVVFRLPDRDPDMAGVLVDRAGEPVGFAFVDIAPIGPTDSSIAQQERTDAAGRWAVYHMPPGRYRLTAHAEGRGVTTTTIASPRTGVRLELGGVGRLEGVTTRLPTGSFELVLGTCDDLGGAIPLPPSRRLVTVSGGQFTIDDLPACELTFSVIWRGQTIAQRAAIPSNGVAHVEVDLGPPRPKTVHGIVRGPEGKPVAGARVAAVYRSAGRAATRTNGAGNAMRPDDAGTAATRTDAAGAYTLETFSSAWIRATAPGVIGFAPVGNANIDREQVDIVVDDASDVELDE